MHAGLEERRRADQLEERASVLDEVGAVAAFGDAVRLGEHAVRSVEGLGEAHTIGGGGAGFGAGELELGAEHFFEVGEAPVGVGELHGERVAFVSDLVEGLAEVHAPTSSPARFVT
jgi:hypothetical protein